MLLAGWAWGALAVVSAQVASSSPARQDADVRRAWELLSEAEQDDALARFEAEIAYLDTFGVGLVRYARALEERDLSFLPVAGDPEFYDPAVHAPAQPIPRVRLAPDSTAAVRVRERMFEKFPERSLRVAWRYDWGRGEVCRVADPMDRSLRFENALAGHPPGLDLAEALVERALDDGSQRKALAAFGHAYTDRTGAVYPGVTLYDAWASGTEIEMADVDTLGIVHDVLDEWRKWTSPVPASKHDSLYQRIGELFVPANRHRELRVAIARTFADGVPEMRPPYSTCTDRFHALWEAHASTPSEVAKVLPPPEQWSKFLAEWNDKASGELHGAAVRRRRAFVDERRRIRDHWVEVLADLGAFERTSKPAAEHPAARAK